MILKKYLNVYLILKDLIWGPLKGPPLPNITLNHFLDHY